MSAIDPRGFCPWCGKPNRVEYRFCQACDRELPPPGDADHPSPGGELRLATATTPPIHPPEPTRSSTPVMSDARFGRPPASSAVLRDPTPIERSLLVARARGKGTPLVGLSALLSSLAIVAGSLSLLPQLPAQVSPLDTVLPPLDIVLPPLALISCGVSLAIKRRAARALRSRTVLEAAGPSFARKAPRRSKAKLVEWKVGDLRIFITETQARGLPLEPLPLQRLTIAFPTKLPGSPTVPQGTSGMILSVGGDLLPRPLDVGVSAWPKVGGSNRS